MTENPPAKPRFTRRRVLAGALVLVVILAVATLGFGVLDGESPGPVVKARFLRFETATDGKSIHAVLALNHSRDRRATLPTTDSLIQASGQFFSQTATGWVTWLRDPKVTSIWVPAQGGQPIGVTIPLPQDGRTGHVGVGCWVVERRLPRVVSFVHDLFPRAFPEQHRAVWAVCTQEIQCPKLRPDGTVEPPRIISKADANP